MEWKGPQASPVTAPFADEGIEVHALAKATSWLLVEPLQGSCDGPCGVLQIGHRALGMWEGARLIVNMTRRLSLTSFDGCHPQGPEPWSFLERPAP